ncbi:ornithine cyclodeaminase family protein [Pontibacillus salicampi]|uniref:Ornithine cyclodeaminase family protein n=1 Tax=Pontibacillus salicampi TaxID=1449801 RepID=A0ABV6LPR2_9BACI
MNYLTEDITNYLSVKDVMEEYERFHQDKEKEGMINPDRMHVEDEKRTALLMPAFYDNYYSVKIAGVSPDNSQWNKPMVNTVIVLYKRDTMEPVLTFDGNQMTGIRTAAIGGLGMKYLSPLNATVLGLIGTGVQAWTHLEAAMAVRDITEVYVYSRTTEKLELFQQQVQDKYPQLTVHTASVDEVVEKADILVTVTGSSSPVLPEISPAAWGAKHITAVGSFRPDMQEIPDSILQNVPHIYMDQPAALHESGDMIRAKELRPTDTFDTLDTIVQSGKQPTNNVSLFKCVGSSIYDLLATKKLYERLYE